MSDLPTDEARRALELADLIDRTVRVARDNGTDKVVITGKPEHWDVVLASLRAKTAGGAEEMRERAAHLCAVEAGLCVADIVVGDEIGARLAHARASALLTASDDIRALPLDPSPQGEGGGDA